MSDSREALLIVLRCHRSRRVQKVVETRIQANQCLGVKDDGSECDEKPVKLGLCQKCHSRFYHVLSKKAKYEQQQYRQRLIQSGRLLADREVTTLKSKSIWSRLG